MDGSSAISNTHDQNNDFLILDAFNRAGNVVAVLEEAPVVSGLRVVSANVALSQALGRSVADIQDAPADFLVGDDHDPARLDRLRNAIRLNEPLQETITIQIDGRQVWIGIRLMPTLAESVKPRRFVLLGRDITERRRRAAADEAMQILLGQAFRQAEIAMAVIESGGSVVMSNDHFHKLCDREASAIDGLDFTNIFCSEDVPAAVSCRERQLRDEKSYDAILRVTRRGDEMLAVRLHCSVLRHRNLRRLRIVTLIPLVNSEPGMQGQLSSGTPPKPVLLAGGIRLIGLEEIRKTLGTCWPEKAEKVMGAAEQVLRHHLLPGESFFRDTRGTGFIVCFAGADVREGELRAAIITREIKTRLIGDFDDARMAATTLTLDPQPITASERDVSTERLSKLMEKRLQHRLGVLEEQARMVLTEAAVSGRCILIQATTPANVPLPLVLVDLPRDLQHSLETAMLSLPEAEMRGFDPTRIRLEGFVEAAVDQIGNDRRTHWIVPINFDSVTDRYRREKCLKQLSALPTALRQQLIPLLSQLPKSLYQAGFEEILRLLKGFGRTVGVEVDDLEALPFDPKCRVVSLVMVKGSVLTALLRRGGAAARIQRLRSESVRVIARDIGGLSTADLNELGVDLVINEPR